MTNDSNFTFDLSDDLEDRNWDDFLVRTPGGHHTQTSLWARLKLPGGWCRRRILIKRNRTIVAGAQMLLKSIRPFGYVGYIPKGPLLAEENTDLVAEIFRQLQKTASQNRIQLLVVEPPLGQDLLVAGLQNQNFQPTSISLAPRATILIDLSRSTDTLMAEMGAKTRYNVRVGRRKGITVREGTASDLPVYYRILLATSERQSFSTFPYGYFNEMWNIFSSAGYIKLFLAEHDGEILSGQIAITFGDTVINKLSVWSGTDGHLRPNEALQWATIQWAKEHGYRYYDLEGIDYNTAVAILKTGAIPEIYRQTVASFKYGFGGDVVCLPGAYAHFGNPLLAHSHQYLFQRISQHAVVKRTLNSLRTR